MVNETERKCKICGFELYSKNSIEAGYCAPCADQYEDAKNVWKEKGLARFCSKCGMMIHFKDSIATGMCIVCRRDESY